MITIYRRYIARSWMNDEFLMNFGAYILIRALPRRAARPGHVRLYDGGVRSSRYWRYH